MASAPTASTPDAAAREIVQPEHDDDDDDERRRRFAAAVRAAARGPLPDRLAEEARLVRDDDVASESLAARAHRWLFERCLRAAEDVVDGARGEDDEVRAYATRSVVTHALAADESAEFARRARDGLLVRFAWTHHRIVVDVDSDPYEVASEYEAIARRTGPDDTTSRLLTHALRLSCPALCEDRRQLVSQMVGGRLSMLHETEPDPGVERFRSEARGFRARVPRSAYGRSLWTPVTNALTPAGSPCVAVGRGHRGEIASVAFLDDGTRVATGGADGAVRVWDARDGRPIAVLEVGDATSERWEDRCVRALSLHRDQRRLATCYGRKGNGGVLVWDVRSKELLLTTEGHGASAARDVEWSRGGTRLASCGDDKTVRVWDADSGRLLRVLELGFQARSVSWSADDARLATCGFPNHDVHVWTLPAPNDEEKEKEETTTTKDDSSSPSSENRVRVLRGHGYYVSCVAFSPDGEFLASGGEDVTVRVWDAETADSVCVFYGHDDAVKAVSWNRDSARIASASDDFTVRVWCVETGERLRTIPFGNSAPSAVAWNDRGDRLATGGTDWIARVWDVAADAGTTDYRRRPADQHTKWIQCAAWNADGTLLATGSDDETVGVWDALTGRRVLTLEGHDQTVMSLTWSRDGAKLRSRDVYEYVRVWDATTGTLLFEEGHDRKGYEHEKEEFDDDDDCDCDESSRRLDASEIGFSTDETSSQDMENLYFDGKRSVCAFTENEFVHILRRVTVDDDLNTETSFSSLTKKRPRNSF